MTVQSKKREQIGFSQPESLYRKNKFSNRRAETMLELMIENKMEKTHSKLFNDVCMRKLELQKLPREIHLLPKIRRDPSETELRGLAGQPKNVWAGKVTWAESISEKEDIWCRDRRYESFTGGVNDEVWKHLRMTVGIPDLPESPEIGPTSGKWTNNEENIGLPADCNSEEFVSGLMELCNLTDTGDSWEVQSAASASGMTFERENQIHVQSSSSKDECSIQHKNFNVDLFKTEICARWNNYGKCIYGKSCRFAHGTNELRERPKPNRNYKTAICKKFLSGFCPYGSRCYFIHDLKNQNSAIGGGHLFVNGLPSTMVHPKQNRDMIQRWKR